MIKVLHGVPVSGAMDQVAMNLANMLVGNNKNEAVIEFALLAPRLLFEVETTIVLTGASFQPKINNLSVSLNKLLSITPGDELSFVPAKDGVYGYLGVSGGFRVTPVMGSTSYYTNMADDLRLEKDMIIRLNRPNFLNLHSKINYKPNSDNDILKAYKGPEFNLLSKEQRALLLNTKFSVSKTFNRMGIHLEKGIDNDFPSIITSGVMPGTVQLTPSGKLIVLMRDAQTTGGYPRILQLADDAINKISQKRFQDQLRFNLV